MSVQASGVVLAALVALIGNTIGLIIAAKWRSKYWKEFKNREIQLTRAWNKQRTQELTLTYPRMWKRFPLLMFGVILSLFVISLVVIVDGRHHSESYSSDVAALVISFFLAGIVPSVLFAEAYSSDCRISESALCRMSLWTGDFCVRWDEIESVVYNTRLKSYLVTTSKGTIRVRATLQGIGAFLEVVCERIPPWKRSGGFHPVNLLILQELRRN